MYLKEMNGMNNERMIISSKYLLMILENIWIQIIEVYELWIKITSTQIYLFGFLKRQVTYHKI